MKRRFVLSFDARFAVAALGPTEEQSSTKKAVKTFSLSFWPGASWLQTALRPDSRQSLHARARVCTLAAGGRSERQGGQKDLPAVGVGRGIAWKLRPLFVLTWYPSLVVRIDPLRHSCAVIGRNAVKSTGLNPIRRSSTCRYTPVSATGRCKRHFFQPRTPSRAKAAEAERGRPGVCVYNQRRVTGSPITKQRRPPGATKLNSHAQRALVRRRPSQTRVHGPTGKTRGVA